LYAALVTQVVRDGAGDDVAFEKFEHVPPSARGAYRGVYE
jgi:hypothetical protein